LGIRKQSANPRDGKPSFRDRDEISSQKEEREEGGKGQKADGDLLKTFKRKGAKLKGAITGKISVLKTSACKKGAGLKLIGKKSWGKKQDKHGGE